MRRKKTRANEDTRPGATISRPGSPVSSAKAKQIAPVLRRLEKENTLLRPDDVVEEARNPKSPLHDLFEWDDTKAAHQHRLSFARTIIKSVSFRVQIEGGGDLLRTHTPAFQPVKIMDPEGNPSRGYVSRNNTTVLSRAGFRQLELENAIRELNGWKRRFNTVLVLSKGLAGVFDDLLEQLVALQTPQTSEKQKAA